MWAACGGGVPSAMAIRKKLEFLRGGLEIISIGYICNTTYNKRTLMKLEGSFDMPGKSVSLSVRLSPEEAAFLAAYKSPGATTLSEKLRAVISEARKRRAGSENYAECLAFVEELLAPSLHRLRETETAAGLHSELLLNFAHWLPDVVAYSMVNVPDADEPDAAERLANLEAAIADRIFVLIEQVLRLGVTGESPCYDPTIITKRMPAIIKLNDIIKMSYDLE